MEGVTTAQAAALVKRTEGHVRRAIIDGRLPATRHGYTWRVGLDDLKTWDAATTRRSGRRPAETLGRDAVEMLALYEAMTSDELALLLDLHPGNARKRLALLAKRGMVERDAHGEWTLTTTGRGSLAAEGSAA